MDNRNSPITSVERKTPDIVLQQARATGVVCEETYVKIGLTKLEHLAMKIYKDHLNIMGGITDGDMKEAYDHAMKTANYFFDRLEKGNE